MSTTDLDRRAPSEALVTRDDRGTWDDKQIALISRTVAKDATAEELHFFLNVSARYNLDPFQGEIYCSKMRGKNGGEGRIAIIVGEQGRLKIANRYPDYKGFRSDVVCENDRFIKLDEPKDLRGVVGQFTYVEHSYGKPTERGEIVGAWCEVYRDGRPSTFFYAPLEDYLPSDASEREQQFSPWFKTRSRMIVKCADSTAFRMAFNLAGIYGEEEIEHIRASESATVSGVTEEEVAWGDSPETAERMRSLFAAANNAKEGSYPLAKVRMMLAGLSDEERLAIGETELIPFITKHGGTVPEDGEEVVAAEDVTVEDPTDDVPEETLPGMQ